MNKYFQWSFFIFLVSGLMILYARLGIGRQSWLVSDSHLLKVGLLGVCIFCIGYGFLLAALILGEEE